MLIGLDAIPLTEARAGVGHYTFALARPRSARRRVRARIPLRISADRPLGDGDAPAEPEGGTRPSRRSLSSLVVCGLAALRQTPRRPTLPRDELRRAAVGRRGDRP